MQKSVLTEIIRSLEKKEKREIQKWLLSPAHNQRQDVIRLFEFLSKHTAASDSDIEKEKAWKYVFPGMPYDDAYLRQVMYFLLKVIEDYLVFTEITNDSTEYQLALMRTFRQRKLEKPYKQVHRVCKDHLESQPLRDSKFLHKIFQVEQEYGELANIATNAAANLQETSDALEKWFIAEKLHVTYAMHAHQTVYKTAKYDYGMLDTVFDYLEEKDLLTQPAIAVYYFAYKTLTNPNDETYFDRLEQLIQKHEQEFTQSEFRTIYVAAVNYCIPKITQGRRDFAERAFKLYTKGLERGVLFENGLLSRYTFGNAVAFAIRVEEFAWAERFVEENKKYLEEKLRNSIVNFNLSRIYFEKGEYSKAQKLLREFEYDDLHLNIIAKTMLLKIYFETDEYDAFESLLESMRIYLRRKEALDPTRKTAYKNMISLMKKLVNRNPYSKAQTEKLRELVVSTNPLMERDWLLGQLDKK
jgi:hypothetical protein